MRNKIRVSGLAIACVLVLVGSVPGLASSPALSLSDGSNVITVDGSGNVTYGGTCTLATCTTTFSSVLPAGTVNWSGTIGGFTVPAANPIVGESKPFLTSPVMDLGIPGLTSAAAGTFTVEVSDIGFAGINPTSISPGPSFRNGASGSVNYSLYVDNTNALFGMGTLSASLTGVPSGIPTASGAGITANPFSMTLVEAVAFTAGGLFSDDYSGSATVGSIVTPPPSPITHGDAATIGFWHNKNGQAVIDSLNGGGSSTALTNWLSGQFPNLYGSLLGGNDASVAALFLSYFGVKGQKTNAQILAGALAAYVTSTTLAGNNSTVTGFGFNTSPGGTGAKSYNVGTNGTAVGLVNNQSYTVLQLLQQANLDSPLSAGAFNAFNNIFDGINSTGDIQ